MINRLKRIWAALLAAAVLAASGCYQSTQNYSAQAVEAAVTAGTAAAVTTELTTTAAATTSATTTAAPEPDLSAKENLNNEKIMIVQDLKNGINENRYFTSYFYNFCDKITTGLSDYDYLVPIETDLYGIKAEVTDKTIIKVRLYNNSDREVNVISSFVESCSDSDSNTYFNDKLSFEKTESFDASELPDFMQEPTPYRFSAELSVDGNKKVIYCYFFTNIDEVKLCAVSNINDYSYNDITEIKIRRADILFRIKEDNIDPSEEISVIDTIYYPYWHFNDPENYRCDTERWVETAKTIVTDDMSDELKVWKFYRWLMDNIAYDDYLLQNHTVESGAGYSRAVVTKDYSGKQSIYDLRCGVCVDYANIMAIFCRTYGIPALVISDVAHAWNGIYLNRRWIEVDLTCAAKYYVDTEEVSSRKNYWIYDLDQRRKCDFDPTKAGIYKEHNKNLDAINQYLFTDKEYLK